MRLIPLALALVLAACAKDPPPPVDSFCVKIERKDFTDRGLRAQSPPNIRADLANENTWLRDCGPRSTGLRSPAP